jgi:hypothetical protein
MRGEEIMPNGKWSGGLERMSEVKKRSEHAALRM